MVRKSILSAFILVLLLSLASCGDGGNKQVNSDATQTQTPTPTVESTTVTATPTPSPQPDATAEFKLPVEGVRPVAVMIDNEGTKKHASRRTGYGPGNIRNNRGGAVRPG